MLNHPIPNAPFVLDTDASASALGGVLSQETADGERVIAYASQTLTKSQKNYCTTHRELLAVVQMTQHFKHYLWGRRFKLRTDHSSLRWLLSYKDADGMLARWLAKLQQYDFVIEHRPGVKHANADALSRCHSCKRDDCPGKLLIPATEPETSSDELHLPKITSPKSHTSPTELADFEERVLRCRLPSGLNARSVTIANAIDEKLNSASWLSDFTRADIIVA